MTDVPLEPLEVDSLDYKAADLSNVFGRTSNRAFARDANAPSASKPSFRSLNWNEMAVKIVAPEPEPVIEDAPEASLDQMTEPRVEADNATKAGDPVVAQNPAPAPPDQSEPLQAVAPSAASVAADEEGKLQKMRDDAYAEGFSAGKAMTENEREAELTAQYEALEHIIAGLSAPDLLDTEALSQNINAAVFELASERIGFALEEMPELLTARIDRLLDRLAHLSADRVLFVAPEDLGLVQLSYKESQSKRKVELRSDPTLRRGDVRLRVGWAEICDILEGQAIDEPKAEDPSEIELVAQC
jgi:flagellar assembly protein FliH